MVRMSGRWSLRTNWRRLVNRQPFRTRAVKPLKDSDVTNLMFLGSQQEIENAFQAAGWSTAEQLEREIEARDVPSDDRAARLQGSTGVDAAVGRRPPDLVFQKQTNTFNARHHLRIWHRPGRFHGKEIWVCSATHDTGIDFSEENRTFIHRVDGEIDHERAKVVNDLLFTGLVKELSLVDRPGVPTSLVNATGDKVETDGKMVVVGF